MRQLCLVLLACVLSANLSPAIARACERRADAAAAYERGVLAQGRGELGKAAEAFALADLLCPSAVALKAALDAVAGTDDAALAAALLDRAEQSEIAGSVRRVEERFAARLGRLAITCSASCTAEVDGTQRPVGRMIRVLTDEHRVVVFGEGWLVRERVRVDAGGSVEVVAAPPVASRERPIAAADALTATAAASRDDRRSGMSAWAWAGVAVTGLLAGGASWSALDTMDRHDRFVSSGCPSAPFSGCDALSSSGESAETRTNVLLAGALVSAVATTLLAILLSGERGEPDEPGEQGGSGGSVEAAGARGTEASE